MIKEVGLYVSKIRGQAIAAAIYLGSSQSRTGCIAWKICGTRAWAASFSKPAPQGDDIASGPLMPGTSHGDIGTPSFA